MGWGWGGVVLALEDWGFNFSLYEIKGLHVLPGISNPSKEKCHSAVI